MCSVLKTRWPVSAAVIVELVVSKSRISPTIMISGSCRNTCLRPNAKFGQSKPISRCSIILISFSNKYSTGSSNVTIRFLYFLFINPIIPASVVLLPEPVWPVTITNPLGMSVSSLTIGGRFKSSIKGI
ncbi:hypothetical protein ES703_110475 [subsurface metagenome]